MNYTEKKANATELGLEFKGNISEADLDELLEDAAIAAKAATYAVPVEEKEVVKKTKKAVRSDSVRESTLMLKVIITPLASNKRELPGEIKVHMSKTGTKKQVIKFGDEQLVYKVIVDMMKEEKTLLQIKVTNRKGKEITTKKESPAYIIQEIPLTDEDLLKLKGQ